MKRLVFPSLVMVSAASLLVSAPAFGQTPPQGPSSSRMFGTEDDPRPDLRPAGPPVVMRLRYTRATGAEACPDEQVFRDAVGAQVRRSDPFAPNGPWLLTVTVSRRGGYEGSAELRDVTGAVVFTKSYPPTSRCLDAIGDLARAIAFEIERPALRARSPQAAPPPPPADPPSSSTPAASPPAPPRLLALRLGVGAWADLATAPRPAFALSGNVGLRAAWFSVDGELRWSPPAAAQMTSGVTVETSRILGALVPCGHAGWFAGCLLGELGQIRGRLTPSVGSSATPESQAGLFLAGGVRLAAEIPVVRGRNEEERLSVRIAADLAGARPVAFRAGPPGQKVGAEQWESGAFVGGLGAGLLASF